MRDPIRDEALSGLRSIVWEMESLMERMEKIILAAKEKLALIQALEKDSEP